MFNILQILANLRPCLLSKKSNAKIWKETVGKNYFDALFAYAHDFDLYSLNFWK